MKKINLQINQTAITMTVVVLAIISAAVETDLFVPSFPTLKSYFDTTEEKIQLLLSVNFAGLCLSGLFYGPLSDSYGRRPILLMGMSLFAVAALGCYFSTSLESLLCWRFLQGVGCSAAFIVPGAIIYDMYSQEEAARVMSFYNTLITSVMAGAPILGSYLYLTFDWHANFLFVAILSTCTLILIWLFVHETHLPENRSQLHIKTILSNYWRIFKDPRGQANIAIVCCVFGSYLIFIANLSLIFIEHLHVDKGTFGFYQASILLTFAIVSINAHRVMDKLGLEKTRIIGKLTSFVGACALLCVAYFAPTNPVLITTSMAIFTGGFAFMISIIFGDYMALYPDIRGLAVAFSSAERLMFISIVISISGALFTGSIMPVAIMVFILSTIATSLTLLLKRKKDKEAQLTSTD